MQAHVTARATAYPGGDATKKNEDDIDRLLAELLPLSGRELAPADSMCTAIHPTIRHVPTFGGEVELDEVSSVVFRLAPIAILEFSAVMELTESAIFENFSVPSRDESYVLERLARRRLEEAIANVAFATCLAMPFRIHIGEPTFLPENEPVKASVRWSRLGRTAHAADMDWPTVQELPLEGVLDWLDRLPGFREGIGRGPVGRAVAALSQALAADTGSPHGLVWSMVGLEALFCRKSDGLKRQLSENSQLLLGAIRSHRKHFSRLYDYRSEFLHGARDVRRSGCTPGSPGAGKG